MTVNCALVLSLSILITTGFPLGTISGLALVLACGAFLRSVLAQSSRKYVSAPDKILIGFAESYALGLLLFAPAALLVPMLLGEIDFTLLVVTLSFGLGLAEPMLRNKQSSQGCRVNELIGPELHKAKRTAYMVVAVWIGLAVLDFLVSMHVYLNSFDGTVFLTGDLTNHMAIIQGIGSGTFPPPDYTLYGATPAENPIALTLSLSFCGLLISTTQLQGMGVIFIVITKMYVHAALVPMLYYVLRGVTSKIPWKTILTASLAMGVCTDVSPFLNLLGILEDSVPRGVPFPFDLPSGTAAVFLAPGLGFDSFLASFHHLQVILVFMFILGLLERCKTVHSSTCFIITVGVVELPFFHLGIGVFVVIPLLITMVGFLIVRAMHLTDRRRILFLFKLLVLSGLAGLYLVRVHIAGIVNITLRFTGAAIGYALIGYLGPFVVLSGMGYWWLLRYGNENTRWPIIVSVDFLILFVLFFSISRDSGAGLMPSDYYTLFALQAMMILCFAVGSTRHDYETSMSCSSLDMQRQTKLIETDAKFAEASERSMKRNSRNYHELGQVVGLLFVLISSSLLAGWVFHSNLGEFNREFYGSVPLMSSEERMMFSWIYESSNQTDVILCHTENWEIAGVIGRQIVYSGYHPPDVEHPIYQAYLEMYNSTTVEQSYGLFVEYGIAFVVVSPHERASYPAGIGKFYLSPWFGLSYHDGEYDVFRFIAQA